MRIALVGAELEENLAVRYIRGALQAAGHDSVQVAFNEAAETERAAREIAGSGAELAGFSMVFTYRAREFARLAERARELGFRGHMTAGGHFAAFNAEALLRDVPAFDSVVCGEGEEIMCELARSRADLSRVKGLVRRDGSGRIVRNAPAAKPSDLDSLPHPVRKRPFDLYLGMPIVNMLSSRGCTHSCGFCSISAWHRLCGGERFRLRAPGRVAEEMAGLYREGVRIFNFHDDNFLLGSTAESIERAKALKAALEGFGVGRIAFAVKARPDEVDDRLFGYLKSMGLFRVFLGIEAGTADSLRRLGRGQTLDQNKRALEVVNRLDLHSCFNLLMLNPDSTLEDFAANVAFLRRHPANPMNFCRTEVYAGTPLERRLRREGRLLGDYWGYNYRIADERAQEVFEIVYPAFRERNWGERGLHHQVMDVDYEHQILSHFFGTEPGLRRKVKAFIREVNLNTCGYLEEIVEAVRRGLAGERARRDCARDLTARIEADNIRLYEVGQEMLSGLRALAVRFGQRPSFGMWAGKAAAAAGLVAALAVTEPGCSRRDTFHSEMVPKPPNEQPHEAPDEKTPEKPAPDDESPRPPTHISEMAPRPSHPRERAPMPPKESEPELGDASLIKKEFAEKGLPTIAMLVRSHKAIGVELWLDEEGGVSRSAVSGPKLTVRTNEMISRRLGLLSFEKREAFGKHFVLEFTAEEVEATQIRMFHGYEMAPRPSHMTERTPMPPPDTGNPFGW